MKKETKELIDWIKKQISLAGTIVTDVSQSCWQQDRDKAIKFLDSLPEIESHLCRGGYIQDKNGTPCRDWQAYTWPKLFVPPRRPDVTKIVSVGRRFGKSGLTYHSIVESLSVSDEKKKELHELYEKELRGEE